MTITLDKERLKEIAYRTFEITCYMFPLEEWEIEGDPPSIGENGISAVVKFDGAAEGVMKITVNPELFNAIAENMLGMEEGDLELKEGALCEIANIICGNTVPIFAKDDKICYIRSPKIVDGSGWEESEFESMEDETVEVQLDEGVAEISIYYKEG